MKYKLVTQVLLMRLPSAPYLLQQLGTSFQFDRHVILVLNYSISELNACMSNNVPRTCMSCHR